MAQQIRRLEPQQARARQSRERVLTAAAQLFAEDGLADVTTNHIAAHAGMSIGSLYRYFGDKAEIVAVLRSRAVTELEQRFSSAVVRSASIDTYDGIVGVLTEMTDVLAARRGLYRALMQDASATRGLFGEMERRLVLLTRAHLLHLLGPRADEELEAMAYVMVGVGLTACARIGLDPPRGVPVQALLEQTARMISAWLSAPLPASAPPAKA